MTKAAPTIQKASPVPSTMRLSLSNLAYDLLPIFGYTYCATLLYETIVDTFEHVDRGLAAAQDRHCTMRTTSWMPCCQTCGIHEDMQATPYNGVAAELSWVPCAEGLCDAL